MHAATRLVFAFVVGALPCQAVPAAKAARACENERSALGGIACELGRALGAQASNAVVVGLAPTLSPSTPLAAGVAVSLAVDTALALGGGASAWPLAEARARLPYFSSPRPLVVIQPNLEGDALEGALELYAPSLAPSANGAPAPQLRLIVRLSARRALDAEVRHFLPAVTIAAREFVRLGPTDNDVVALACGDLDGTGVSTIASIGRTFVTFGTYVGGKYTPTSRREQRELSPIAPVPLREPIGAAWITPSRALEFGLTDRAHALRLRAGGEPEALSARLPWPGGGCVDLEPPLVAPSAVRCKKDEPVLAAPALADALDALAGAALVSRTGAVQLVRAGRRASDGSAVLTDGTHEIRLEHAGAQLAVADLDGDGNAELVTSLDTLDVRADAIVVYSWLGASLNERLRVAVPAGVHALAVCPSPAARMAPIVVATTAGLWVLR